MRESPSCELLLIARVSTDGAAPGRGRNRGAEVVNHSRRKLAQRSPTLFPSVQYQQ